MPADPLRAAAMLRPSVVFFIAVIVDGEWRFGIGDRSFVGWFTVGAYGLAAIVAGWRRARHRAVGSGARFLRFWAAIAGLMIGLGINKQLDLQQLVTQVGRDVAKEHGWYGDRRVIQALAFFAAFFAALLVVRFILRRWSEIVRRERWTVAGVIVLAVFVTLRVASFHHIDHLFARKTFGARPEWVLELVGIALVIFGAVRDAPRAVALNPRSTIPSSPVSRPTNASTSP